MKFSSFIRPRTVKKNLEPFCRKIQNAYSGFLAILLHTMFQGRSINLEVTNKNIFDKIQGQDTSGSPKRKYLHTKSKFPWHSQQKRSPNSKQCDAYDFLDRVWDNITSGHACLELYDFDLVQSKRSYKSQSFDISNSEILQTNQKTRPISPQATWQIVHSERRQSNYPSVGCERQLNEQSIIKLYQKRPRSVAIH